ncbi:MAG: cupin domain-containing protein [candidate division Zixibacteria bacterium]|nr:cupin domain-containing protein [candidate division Zixibacteria bacterium]
MVNIKECESYITRDGSLIREILAPRNSSLEGLSLAEATVSVGGTTIEHYHEGTEEIYYILSGQGEIVIEGQGASVRAGDGIVIPAGAMHKIQNRGDDDLVFLCICAPPYEHEKTVITESKRL